MKALMRLYVQNLRRPINLTSVEALQTTAIAEMPRRLEPFTDHQQHKKDSSCQHHQHQVRETSRTCIQLHDKNNKPEGEVGQIRVPSLSSQQTDEKDICS